MKLDDNFLYEPRFFDMLVSSTGLLSGEQRKERIIKIAKKNIWLAARCKNTCINEEGDIVEWLIRRAKFIYSNFHDIHAIAALVELREYGELSLLLDIMVKNPAYANLHKDVFLLIQKNERSVSHAFAIISQYLEKDLAVSIFRCLTELGYSLESEAYNAIIARAESREEIEELIQQMTQYGVEADAATYSQLTRKADSYDDAISYFNKFRSIANFSDIDNVVNAYNAMLRKAPNTEETKMLFNDFKAHYSNVFIQNAVSTAYYSRSIEISKTYEEAKGYFKEYWERYILELFNSQELKKKVSSRKKRSIQVITDTYITRITSETIPYDTILEAVSAASQIYSFLGKNIDRKYIEDVSNLILNSIHLSHDFQKGKQLISIVLNNNLWISQRCFDEMLTLVQDKNNVDYVFDNKDLLHFRPQNILKAIQVCQPDISEFIFDTARDYHYPVNIIHYNSLIKKVPLEKAFTLIREMISEGFVPDKFTIQPMLRKWTTIRDFTKIASLATSQFVLADERTAPTIAQQAEKNNLSVDFINFANEESEKINNSLGETWRKAINTASYILNKRYHHY